MEGRLRIHVEYDTLTGMQQGLWPRFYLQMQQLGQLTIGTIDIEERLERIRTKLLPELEQLHQSYALIMHGIGEYQSGVTNGKYFRVATGGSTHMDRGPELAIRKEAKQFIIQAKLVYLAFVNSEFIDESGFSLKKYALTQKLTSQLEQYAKSEDPKYLPLLAVIEKANALFLNDLTKLRGDIEHQSFVVDRFELVITEAGATVQQPLLQGAILSEKITFFYEHLLQFIEKIMAYFIGINAERAIPGMTQLFVDDIFDYQQQRYKYTFTFGGVPCSLTARRCLYD